MKAFVIENGLDQAMGRGITIRRCHDVGAEGLADRRNVLERVGIGLADQLA
jgi:hypothetical protein